MKVLRLAVVCLGLFLVSTQSYAFSLMEYGPRVNATTIIQDYLDLFGRVTLSRISSPNKQWYLELQYNCDVGYYRNGVYQGWHAWNGDGDAKEPGLCYLAMQNDGNFVLYVWGYHGTFPFDYSGWFAEWSSGTYGNPGAFLQSQDDGNFVILSADGRRVLWSLWYGRAY